MSDVDHLALSIFTTSVTSVGLIGNTLNFIILNAYHTSQLVCAGGESTARLNLLGLAIADFFVCLTSLPLSFAKQQYDQYSFMAIYTVVGPALATYSLTISAWMVLLMSVVRYLAVCRPLTSRTWLTPPYMTRIIIIFYILAAIVHIPTFMWYSFEEHYITNYTEPGVTNVCNITIVVTERWTDKSVQTAYHVVLIILTNIGPFLGVVLSYLAVIRACRRSDQCRRSFVDSSMKESVMNVKGRFTRQMSSQSAYKQPIPAAHLLNKQVIAPHKLARHSDNRVQYKTSFQKYPNLATNRVTPLLLAVIFAFLLFTAPFGIVHFVCLRIMKEMGGRLYHDSELRSLYRTLNLTVSWTNAIQLLGSASNFFLYFFVSTIFRRTTKRTLNRMYKRIRGCQTEIVNAFLLGRRSQNSYTWENDERTNELRRELDMKFGKELNPKRSINLFDQTRLRLKVKNHSSSSSKSQKLNEPKIIPMQRPVDISLNTLPSCTMSYSRDHGFCHCHCSGFGNTPLIISHCIECGNSLRRQFTQSDNHLLHVEHTKGVHTETKLLRKNPNSREYGSAGEMLCTCGRSW